MKFTSALLLFLLTTPSSALGDVDSSLLSEKDVERARAPRPDFHDDSELMNERLVDTIPSTSLVACESLSLAELDERLFVMEDLKSRRLNEIYEASDYRKNPYHSPEDLAHRMLADSRHINENVQRALKCRELVTSYVHRLTETNKRLFLDIASTLPLLAQDDGDLYNVIAEEEDHGRRLCR